MPCPQCGSINIEKDGSRENYNMAKGMVGQALVGDLGSLAGFENQIVWKCKSCGCRFVEGLNKNKIITRGIEQANYYNVGIKTVEVKGNAGYTYRVDGIHLDISKNGIRENHFEIPTFEKVEYKFDNPTLILNYLCKDGRVRTKSYTDLSKDNLIKLVNAMKQSLEAFKKDQWHDFIMSGKKETEIVEIKDNGDSYKDKVNSTRIIISLILSLAIGIYIGISTWNIPAALGVAGVSFPISYVTLALQKK